MKNHSQEKEFDFSFEGLSADELVNSLEIAEMPIKSHVFQIVGLSASLLVSIIFVRMLILGPFSYAEYRTRAIANLEARKIDPAPRGVITDRNGVVLADNQPSFLAFLRLKEFIASSTNRITIMRRVSDILKVTPDTLEEEILEGVAREKDEILISEGLDEAQIVAFQSQTDLPVTVRPGFTRDYKDGPQFATVLGYTGRIDAASLARNPKLKNELIVGKAGIEAYYDDALRGINGYTAERRNAKGVALNQAESVEPVSGNALRLTIDSGLQKYFYNRLTQGLASLGRESGAGLAMNPQTGEILAMISLPSYDNTILSSPGK
ncbi:MAG: hypothetical protein AAB691_04770, partial [Patescibacteria group bacterium]